MLGIYTVRSQIKSAQELKSMESKDAFVLKAAEIVMSAGNPFATKNKAEILKIIFKDRLPDNFLSTFNPSDHHKPGPSVDTKIELFRHLMENPEKEIVNLWLRMFPGDKIEKLFPGDYEH